MKNLMKAHLWLKKVFYNFIRPHESLKGKTPAEAVGLDLGLKHKWHELIELATIYQVKG